MEVEEGVFIKPYKFPDGFYYNLSINFVEMMGILAGTEVKTKRRLKLE